MVAQRTLTPYVRVRILLPLPKRSCLLGQDLFAYWIRTRGRLAICRGHMATRGGLRRSAGRILLPLPKSSCPKRIEAFFLQQDKKAPALMLDIARSGRYNEHIKGRCDKRLTPTLTVHSKATKDRHLAEWRSLLFTMIVTVNRPICNVIRIAPPPFGMV